MAESKQFEDSLDYVSIRDHYDEELLLRFYNGLMKTNFPIGDELEAVENWVDNLNPENQKKHNPKAFVLDVILAMIKGTEPETNPASIGSHIKLEEYASEKNHPGAINQEDKKVDHKRDGRTISGGIVFEYYKESACGLVTYFVVDARYRKQGVVKILLKRALNQLTEIAKKHGKEGCHVILAETNATGVEDGVMPSTVRHKIMQRLGMAHIGVEYIQPPLDEGKDECYDLLLIAYLESPAIKKEGKNYTVPAEHVKAWLKEFAAGCYGFDTNPEDYVHKDYYKRLFKQFDSLTNITVNPELPWPGPIKHDHKEQKDGLKRLIIAGPPAGGKGTQCDFLKSKYDLVHLSTGDLLRDEVKKGSELGHKAKVFMDKGELVPNHLLIDVVKEKLKGIEEKGKGWLLDGFPRTEDQAIALTEGGVKVNGFVILEVPDEVVTERMEGRRWDPVTNQSYHIKFLPPPTDIANRLIIRSDDNIDKFKVRLGEYHKNVNAVKGFFKPVLHVINGNQSKDAVSAAIVSALESRGSHI